MQVAVPRHMKQLTLPFHRPPKYGKKATHEPNEYVIIGRWGLAHLAKCAINMRPGCGAAESQRGTSDHRKPQVTPEPVISSRWLPPDDSDE